MPISNFIIKRLLNSARGLDEYEDDDIDVARYGLQAIFWEIEKNLYFFIIFLTLGYAIEWIFSLVVIGSVRFFAGGGHVKSVWGCFFLTLLSFIIPILLLPKLIPTILVSIVLVGLFSILMLILMAPLIPENRKKLVDHSKNNQKKITAMTITVIWLILIYIFRQHTLASVTLWTIFLQNIQLFIVLLSEIWKRKNHKTDILTSKSNSE